MDPSKNGRACHAAARARPEFHIRLASRRDPVNWSPRMSKILRRPLRAEGIPKRNYPDQLSCMVTEAVCPIRKGTGGVPVT